MKVVTLELFGCRGICQKLNHLTHLILKIPWLRLSNFGATSSKVGRLNCFNQFPQVNTNSDFTVGLNNRDIGAHQSVGWLTSACNSFFQLAVEFFFHYREQRERNVSCIVNTARLSYIGELNLALSWLDQCQQTCLYRLDKIHLTSRVTA